MWLWKSIKSERILFALLAVYHLAYTLFNYYYRINRGVADAFSYWGLGRWDFSNTNYLDLWKPGNAFFVGLHFYLVELGSPLWVGFAYYSLIGLLGCWVFYLWARSVIKPKSTTQKACVIICAFLPSIHIWTSNLGKEPILFLCIATILYLFQKKKYFSFINFCSFLIIGMVRPHLFVLLSSSLIIGYILFTEFRICLKLLLIGLGLLLTAGSIFVLQRIGYLPSLSFQALIEFQNIQYENYVRMGGSYLNMKDLTILEKVFAFLFRPLDFTSTKYLILFSSFYNSFLLILFSFGTIILFNKRKSKDIHPLYFSLLIYSILSAIAFTFIYGNLGLFIRTKVLCVSFLIPIVFKIILNNKNFEHVET